MAKIVWQDLPRPLSVFTKRNATMRDLGTKKTAQHYSANTKLAMAQKTQIGLTTYYRTASARDNGLDWAFQASAFGLPNDEAPSAPLTPKSRPAKTRSTPPQTPVKQKPSQQTEPPKDGEGTKPLFSKTLFGRLRKFLGK